jgi:histidinol dehydrogenase
VTVSDEGLAELGPHVVTLAETEGLPAHADSVRLRWPT